MDLNQDSPRLRSGYGIRGWAKIWAGTRMGRIGGWAKTRERPGKPPGSPFFPDPGKIYLAMLQRVMPLGQKYFGRPLGSEGILSLSLHHSAREGRPQGH